MDTTIWEIRPKRENDHDQRILAASVKLTEALSARPIGLRSSRILHLSDLHQRTLREAARHGVHLVLHEHRHQSFIGAEQVYAELEGAEDPWSLGRVGIIGAGSAGSTAVNGGANSFNVIDLHPDRLELSMFRALSREGSRGDFRAVHRWSASLRSEAGRLQLGDWKRESKREASA